MPGEESIVVSIEPTEVPQAQIVSPTMMEAHSDQLITFEGLVTMPKMMKSFCLPFGSPTVMVS